MAEKASKVIEQSVYHLSISPDGSLLAVGERRAGPMTSPWVPIHVYSVESGSEVTQLTESKGRKYLIGTPLAFSPDGKHLCSFFQRPFDGTIQSGEILIFDVSSGEVVKELRSPIGGEESPLAISFSPDGKQLLYSAYETRPRNRSIYFRTFGSFNLETGEFEGEFKGHSHWVNSLAFNPRGGTFASGSNDKHVMLWNLDSREKLHEIRCGYDVRSLCFSPDGDTLASAGGSGSERGVDVWKVESTEKIHSLTSTRPENRGHTKRVNQVSFSKDGKLIATGSNDGTVRIWDAKSGQEHKTFNLGSWVSCALFSPDGKYLVAGANRILFWDTASLV